MGQAVLVVMAFFMTLGALDKALFNNRFGVRKRARRYGGAYDGDGGHHVCGAGFGTGRGTGSDAIVLAALGRILPWRPGCFSEWIRAVSRWLGN